MQQTQALPSQWKQHGRAFRRLRQTFTTVTGLLSLGCGRPPDPAKTLEQVASYLGTATLAGDAWIAHRTPNPFTRNTLRKARMNIAEQQVVLFGEAVPAVDTA